MADLRVKNFLKSTAKRFRILIVRRYGRDLCLGIQNNGGAERDRTVGLLNAIQALSQLSYSPTQPKSNMVKSKLSKYMAPEVGIPSLNELVQSEAEGGQAHEHRVGAPRDFESIPNHRAISHHFWILINQALTEVKLE